MGEAFLHQTGSGMRFRALSVSLPAPYNVFYNGQAITLEHATITANMGRASVILTPGNCVLSPATATTGLTSFTVSCTIGATTRSVTVPITVIPTSNTFGNNSWAVIAQAAYYGFPKLIWNLGDTKTETINGVTHTIRIIGFDHDDLSDDDGMYNDALYNGGTKKTALTLQFSTALKGKMNTTLRTPGGWQTSTMRNTTLPAVLGMMPAAMKNNIRKVSKWSRTGLVDESQDDAWVLLSEDLFLITRAEANYYSGYFAKEILLNLPCYGLFEVTTPTNMRIGYIFGDYTPSGLSPSADGEWTRDVREYSASDTDNRYRYFFLNNTVSYPIANGYGDSERAIFPIFNF